MALAAVMAPTFPRAQPVPSVRIGSAELITPTAANTFYTNATTVTNSTGVTARAPELVELARSLKNDPDLIYEFVRNNIDTGWTYGSSKGALGALIDRSASSFDQSRLMVELLREAGFTASYKVGTITLTGSQFEGWTKINRAKPACELLSSGGIPAIINGAAQADCSTYAANVTISSVQLGHAWVSVTIAGTPYVFDPAYKPYVFRDGAVLDTAAGLSSNETLPVATAAETGTDTGVPYIRNVNAEALDDKLSDYAESLQTHIEGNMPAGEIEDLVGGQDIARHERPTGGLRQTTLPYTSSVLRTFNGGIPDQYRATLKVTLTKARPNGTYDTIADKVLYADEIYGRKLIFDTNFSNGFSNPPQPSTGALKLVDENRAGPTLASYSVSDNPGYSVGDLTLSVTLPYAASAGGAPASYMDLSGQPKRITYATPFTIVHGWGDMGRGLVDKWGQRRDKVLLPTFIPACEICYSQYLQSAGDGRREQLAASWLVQASRAARLHAQIANSIYTHHYSVGVVAADTEIQTRNLNPPGSTPRYVHTIIDSYDRIDIESGVSLTSRLATTAGRLSRRAGLHAIAATLGALEGSVAGQVADLPDVTSTATRFAWGNRPPATEDVVGGGVARRFYEFTEANDDQAIALARVERGASTSFVTGVHGDNETADNFISNGEYSGRRSALGGAVALYAQSGFTVVTSEEAFLGPGQRAGAFVGNFSGVQPPEGGEGANGYRHRQSKQRGGALVATRYPNSGAVPEDYPLEIAHVTIGPDGEAKGGGGGTQTFQQSLYDPSKAADVLKSRFVDRSTAVGVDLKAGAVTYSSPASLSVGNGEFPYRLDAQLIWRGGDVESAIFGPISHVAPPTPWTTNWNNTLTISGSGLEAMGDTDVRATAGTVAAFLAMQDIYKQPRSARREVAGALTAAWWVRQLSGNVATVNVGAGTRQFLRRFDGAWFAPGADSHATLTQTGERRIVAERPVCHVNPPFYVTSRGWSYREPNGAPRVSYDVTNGAGDLQNFDHWVVDLSDDNNTFCARQQGFRLSSWIFPQGMTVTLGYLPGPSSDLPPVLDSVSNTFGRTIKFINSGLGGFHNGLSGTEKREVTVTPGTPLIHKDPGGKETSFFTSIYGERWRLNEVRAADAPDQGWLRYEYDPFSRVRRAFDATALREGVRQPYQFLIADGVRGERIDPLGGAYAVDYDLDGRPFRFTDELGRLTQAAYDGRGRVLGYTYPEGDRETFLYDGRNNPTEFRRIAKPGSGYTSPGDDIVITAFWDQIWNKPEWIKDALGRQTDFTYYASGAGASLLKDAKRPDPDLGDSVMERPTYAFTYNTHGQLDTSTDPTGLVSDNTYGSGSSLGNLLSTTVDPSGENIVTGFLYNTHGDVTRTTDPNGKATRHEYDALRRKTFDYHHDGPVTAALLAAEETVYDALGRVTEQRAAKTVSGTTASNWVTLKTTAYTAAGQPASETDIDQRVTRTEYDALDRPLLKIDGEMRITKFEYDLAGQLLRELRGFGTPREIEYATYAYTSNGQRDSVIDAKNNETDFIYDGFDRLARTRFPRATNGNPNNADDELLSYDKASNVLTRTTRSDVVIDYGYDRLDRMVSKAVGAWQSVPARTTTYAYDLAGRQSRASDNEGHDIEYFYGSAKRLYRIRTDGPQWGNAKNVAYDHDDAGNRILLKWGNISADVYRVRYEYDGLNRMTKVFDQASDAAAETQIAAFTWTPLSQRQEVKYGATGATVTASYSASETGADITGLTHALTGTANDVAFAYGYFKDHRLKSAAVTSPNAGYKASSPAAFSQTWTPNRLNQIAEASGPVGAPPIVFTHDANGNTTSDGAKTYAYDPENRLLAADYVLYGAAYAYDPLGRRVSKSVIDKQANPQTTAVTAYQLDGDDEISEFDGSGTLIRRFIPGPAIDQPVAMVGTDGVRRFFHQDRQGSVVALSTLTGALADGPNAYSEYGQPQGSVGTGPADSPYLFTGRRWDTETGLYYYRARYYDPASGRFLQTDPVGYEDDLNLYAYVGNDPLNYQDPWGDCREGAVATSAFGRGTSTIILCSDGFNEVRSGGSLAWRNNNPGNIIAGSFAASKGSVGRAGITKQGRFAVFPDVSSGRAALGALLRVPSYRSLTPEQAIFKYAPPVENDTKKYQAIVRGALGDTGKKTLGELSDAQMGSLISAIGRVEGWNVGKVTYTSNSDGTATVSAKVYTLGSRLPQTLRCTVQQDGSCK